MPLVHSWPLLFKSFFYKIRSVLPIILEAEGCREGWVQAEAYKHFNNMLQYSFFVNRYKYIDVNGHFKGKADFFCGEDRETADMVAELKVLGDYFLPKNINGYPSFKGIPLNDIRHAYKYNICFNPNEGSLVKDYYRLNDFCNAKNKLLILVMDKSITKDSDQNLREIMLNIAFSPSSKSCNYDSDRRSNRKGFIVRIWKIK